MILNIVKKILKISSTDRTQDEFLSTIIEITLAKVKALCHIPKDNEILQDYDFNLLIAQIAADIYNCYEEDSTSTKSTDTSQMPTVPSGEVKSIQIADYKVEYNTTSKSFSTHYLSESITYNLDKYDEELANYRFMIYI